MKSVLKCFYWFALLVSRDNCSDLTIESDGGSIGPQGCIYTRRAVIEYKLSLHCPKIISDQAVICLSGRLHRYSPSRQIRFSADTRVLRIPSFHTQCSGQRSFPYQASAPTTNPLHLSVVLPLTVLSNLP